jgi:hypothetical protein
MVGRKADVQIAKQTGCCEDEAMHMVSRFFQQQRRNLSAVLVRIVEVESR